MALPVDQRIILIVGITIVIIIVVIVARFLTGRPMVQSLLKEKHDPSDQYPQENAGK